TPEVPGGFRGDGLHLMWLSEIQSWPAATMDEAFDSALIMASLGYARMIWDATPKNGHRLLSRLSAWAAEDPEHHIIVRGKIEANRDNLGVGAPEALRASMGARRAREELDGEFLENDDGALWQQAWIDANRRDLPETLARCIISLDPALSDRRDTD